MKSYFTAFNMVIS